MGGATSSYAYDGDGKRASRTVGGTTTSFVSDLNRGLPVLLDDGTRKHVWGLGLASAVEITGALEVYHPDGPGSVRAITDGTGSVVKTYQTDEFGIETQSQGSVSQPFQYTGEPRDAETGFIYLRARLYDPPLGRFLQRDPREAARCDQTQPLQLNRYAYAEDNPVNRTDPTGMASSRVLSTASGAQAENSLLPPLCTLPIASLPLFRLLCPLGPKPPQPPEFARPKSEPCNSECEWACRVEELSCRADAALLDIRAGGSECDSGYDQCVATGGCFRNPGWRRGPIFNRPEWDKVWPGRRGSCDVKK